MRPSISATPAALAIAFAAAFAAVAPGVAQASMITFETAASNAGPQADAAGYKSAVEAAIGGGANLAVLPLFDQLSQHAVFGGAYSDIAFRATLQFGVSAAQAGIWDLRAGVDFGHGGAIYLDGAALAFRTNDMWWAGGYGDPSQSFQLNGLALSAGNHTLQLFGLEPCCDGAQQAQFRISGGAFTTFGSQDGLAAVVPEPGSAALVALSLAAAGLASRRRCARAS